MKLFPSLFPWAGIPGSPQNFARSKKEKQLIPKFGIYQEKQLNKVTTNRIFCDEAT